VARKEKEMAGGYTVLRGASKKITKTSKSVKKCEKQVKSKKAKVKNKFVSCEA
jgi:hypothetical protein